MRKALTLAYIIFLAIEYFLRTFVAQFKYHTVGFLFELRPIIIATALVCFFNRKTITNKYFHEVYLSFSFFSILGLLTAKLILFYQWYRILHPEYQNDKMDIHQGLTATIIFSVVQIIYILISYLILVVFPKKIHNVKANNYC